MGKYTEAKPEASDLITVRVKQSTKSLYTNCTRMAKVKHIDLYEHLNEYLEKFFKGAIEEMETAHVNGKGESA